MSRHTHLPTPNPPTFLPQTHQHPYPASWLILPPPPATLDYQQISIDFPTMYFSNLDCLGKLRKNKLNRSLSFCGARVLRFHVKFFDLKKPGRLFWEKKQRRQPRKTHRKLFRFSWGEGVHFPISSSHVCYICS